MHLSQSNFDMVNTARKAFSNFFPLSTFWPVQVLFLPESTLYVMEEWMWRGRSFHAREISLLAGVNKRIWIPSGQKKASTCSKYFQFRFCRGMGEIGSGPYPSYFVPPSIRPSTTTCMIHSFLPCSAGRASWNQTVPSFLARSLFEKFTPHLFFLLLVAFLLL